MSYLHRSVLKSFDSRPPNRSKCQKKDCSPITWDKYFTDFKNITINENVFRVYLNGNEGPVLVLLHGGGYSGLTWALFTKEIVSKIQCKVAAIDIRGHGETHTTNDDDLSIENMTDDIIDIVNDLYDQEPVVFIGHSMGGALAVHCAQNLQNCIGLCVIDVVEGTALESLSSMQTFLRNRPNNFINIDHAIQWCCRSGQTHNLESARVSMPGQIKNSLTGKLAASEITENANLNSQSIDPSVIEDQLNKQTTIGTIAEENSVERSEESSSAMMKPPSSYTWRINLSKTEVHWRGWFQGLSELFLNSSMPKLLLLANIHGLDTALTVGQMQGKFQMQVLPKCGHAIHEDLPDKVADIIATYLVRQKLTTALADFTPTFPAC